MHLLFVLICLVSTAVAGLVCDHGKLRCCQATFSGDLPVVIAAAALTGYRLDPRDINCIGSSTYSDSCVGTAACCDVNLLTDADLATYNQLATPLLLGPLGVGGGVGLWCRKPNVTDTCSK